MSIFEEEILRPGCVLLAALLSEPPSPALERLQEWVLQRQMPHFGPRFTRKALHHAGAKEPQGSWSIVVNVNTGST